MRTGEKNKPIMRTGKNIKKEKSSLQSQVKKIIKRKLSTSSVEDSEMLSLKEKVKIMEKQLETYRNSKPLDKTLEPQHAVEEVPQQAVEEVPHDEDSQLYGCHYNEKMISIGNNIYCRKLIYDMALGTSYKATHVARKLLEGVFKKDVLLNATLTGQTPRAQGKERQEKKVVALLYEARNAIVDCSKKIALEREWVVQTNKEIEKSMSQRIGEIKRQELKRKEEEDEDEEYFNTY